MQQMSRLNSHLSCDVSYWGCTRWGVIVASYFHQEGKGKPSHPPLLYENRMYLEWAPMHSFKDRLKTDLGLCGLKCGPTGFSFSHVDLCTCICP